MDFRAVPWQLWAIAAGVAAIALWRAAGGTAAQAGSAIGGAAVDAAGGAVSGVAIGIGDAIGVPRTDETECARAIREGRTWDASFACPAGDWIRYVWGSRSIITD